jgi:Spy/CpxP family protein refolding chaperone
MRRVAGVLLALCVLGAAAPARAEDPDAGGRKARIEARMRRMHAEILRREVDLDEKKAARVEAVLKKHGPERRKLRAQLQRHRHTLRFLLEEDSDDQKAYADAIQGLRAAQKALQTLEERALGELQKELTPKQQARLVMALRKARQHIRRALRRHQRKPWRHAGEEF